MSVDTGSGAEAGVVWGATSLAEPGAPLAGSRGRAGRSRGSAGFGALGWLGGGGVEGVRGPAASLRRDALFRRLLLMADVVAIVGAFLLTIALSRRSVQLTWAGVAAVPILLVGAKLTGLYDRDEALLRKTTLDEAPRLFQLATR